MSAAANMARVQQARAPIGSVTTSSAYLLPKLDLNQPLALCGMCKHKFNFKHHNYVPATRWGRLIGNCDSCRKHTTDQILFIHESFVADSGGKVMSGQVYSPE